MKTFIIVYSIILLISTLITASLFLLRRYFFKPGKDIKEHIHPSIFDFFGALYAFFLGFAIVTLWSAFLTAKANVTKEADVVLTAFRISKPLPQSEAFRQAVLDYVKGIIDDEWGQMENGSMSEKTGRLFDNIWEQYHQLKPASEKDTGIYLNLITYLNEAYRYRLARGLLLEGNLYPPVWVIIVFGFIAVIFCLYFSHIPQNPVRTIFEFIVVFMVLSCIYFIYDINTPFSGYIIVQPEVFQKIYAQMQGLQ